MEKHKKLALFLCCLFLLPWILAILPSTSLLQQVKAEETKVYKLRSYSGVTGLNSTEAAISVFINYDEFEAKEGELEFIYEVEDKTVCEVIPDYYESYRASIKGLKIGSTNIKVYQSAKGVKSLIGTYQIIVKDVEILGDMEKGMNWTIANYVKYPNSQAKYILKIENEKVANLEILSWMESPYIRTLDIGSTNITIQEEWNGNIREIGQFKLVVNPPSIEAIHARNMNFIFLSEAIKWGDGNKKYSFELKNDNVIEVKEEEGYYKGLPKNLGKTKIEVYQTDKDGKKIKFGDLEVLVGLKILQSEIKLGLYDLKWIEDFINEVDYEGYNFNVETEDKNILDQEELPRLVPKKLGTTKLIFTETLKGKTQKSSIHVKVVEEAAQLGVEKHNLYFPKVYEKYGDYILDKIEEASFDFSHYLTCYNPLAQYTLETEHNKFIKIRNDPSNEPEIEYVGDGETKVTVKEKLDGKTRVVGSFIMQSSL